MLRLDFLHRARSPLAPDLRAKLRLVCARTNRCAYGEAYALADLRSAGVPGRVIAALADGFQSLPFDERMLLAFACKLTLAAHTVTDDEMSQVITRLGKEGAVALVLLVAYACFHDRLMLALGLPIEQEGPLPPIDVTFRPPGPESHVAPPPRAEGQTAEATASAAVAVDPAWQKYSFDELQSRMDAQKSRSARIEVPQWDAVRARLPAGYPADKPLRIVWSLVCLGYQPELGAAWSMCTRSFMEDARQDRVFEETLFWIHTRALECFY